MSKLVNAMVAFMKSTLEENGSICDITATKLGVGSGRKNRRKIYNTCITACRIVCSIDLYMDPKYHE